MDRNAYQSELDQVQFTEAGRSALTDALMAEQAGPPVQHRSLWMKRGMAAVLAAVLLVGTAAAVTASLWDSFFGRLDPGEQAVVDTLSGGLPGAVSAGGAMMTPMAAFGMDGAFYLMLEIQAPEGTVLPPLDGENETYQLFGDDILNGEWLELREPDGGDPAISYSGSCGQHADSGTLYSGGRRLGGKGPPHTGAVEADGWEGLYGDLLRRF